MASDLLNMGAQSVLTAQRQLNTTGHNIANANTEGYSRQSVIQGTNAPRQYGGQTYGMGVHVENVRRSWDQFAVKELNLATTDYSFKHDTEENLDMLSKLLSSVASKKIPENLNEWFDSVKSLADTPNDVGARKVVLEKAGLISQNLNDFHETVRRQFDITNKGLDVGIERINQLALEIRDVQRLMMKTPGPHNDLMDQHEKLVSELSQYTKVTVTPRKNAEGFNIHIGSGHTLVSGTEASQLKMIDGYPDVKQRRLAIVEGNTLKPISEKEIGGKLAAQFEMRDEHIPYLMDEIGRLAVSFSHEVNQLQNQGLDLRGNVGENLFTDMNSDAIARSRVVTSSNSNADMAVYIDDLSQLKGGEFSLSYNGSGYVATLPDGQQTPLTLNQGNLYLNGLKIQVNTPPDIGERVIIRPTRDGAAEIKMATNDATKIAAQSYQASTSFAQGNAKFTIAQVGDVKEFEAYVEPSSTGAGNDMEVRIVDKNGQLLATQPYQFAEGEQTLNVVIPAQVPGGKATEFNLTRGAIVNDKFTANLNPAEGDNGNLRKMLYLQTSKKMNDHESTIISLYHNLNTDFGLKVSTASRLTDVARLEQDAAQSRIASVSGVNLDEEAANMMKFQHAYMASSRIMQAANDTFNTILQLR
ncbi:flagellar hook-associated protein FlgK [Vibrio cincinnatiensis]|uniref:flagellar hook-associated protein FlgK n=1 Tax=Vibrio cincinnatiensis TaxID=675 RepID=UPI001EDCC2CB|nr:flagellar hook-associated protein FlgK [Vibrio cincinnatiensis]MCG3730510.1 flagellar hook-associated protein FlgK [Vibrio cincinnatiensis]